MRLLVIIVVSSACAAATGAKDPLWLRYNAVVPNPELYSQITSVTVEVSDPALCRDTAATPALHAVAAELSTGLSGLLGRAVPSTCCGCGAGPDGGDGGDDASPARRALLVTVGGGDDRHGPEGFTVTPRSLTANTPSGALYGAFRLLSFVQQHRPLPASLTSQPAMKIRAWDLWDTLSSS